jgi:hypothetical protein
MTPKRLGFAIGGVLVVLLAGGCAGHGTAAGVHSPASPTSAAPPGVTATVTVTAKPSAVAKPTAPPTSAPPNPQVAVNTDPVLIGNKLYGAGKVPAVRCALPALAPKTDAGLVKYSQTMVECLNRAWAPLITLAHFDFIPATVVGISSKACADPAGPAFYVGVGEIICLDWKGYDKISDAPWRTVVLQFDLAHEYGHHLQRLTGILSRYDLDVLPTAAPDRERRMELQASCFGAAFLKGNKTSMRLSGEKLDDWEDLVSHTGDEYAPKGDHSHGTRKSNDYWAHLGFGSADPASCNTFTAAAKRVS